MALLLLQLPPHPWVQSQTPLPRLLPPSRTLKLQTLILVYSSSSRFLLSSPSSTLQNPCLRGLEESYNREKGKGKE
ncbi:hypothetical protein M758_UG133800 [Ceratodon purpureus]|nr:hypothetical protein M758_UG133800 [Ceratodon purpureus]